MIATLQFALIDSEFFGTRAVFGNDLAESIQVLPVPPQLLSFYEQLSTPVLGLFFNTFATMGIPALSERRLFPRGSCDRGR